MTTYTLTGNKAEDTIDMYDLEVPCWNIKWTLEVKEVNGWATITVKYPWGKIFDIFEVDVTGDPNFEASIRY